MLIPKIIDGFTYEFTHEIILNYASMKIIEVIDSQ